MARRQRSDVVTFSVVYRTPQGTQRWQKLARFPVLTPHLARQEAIKILRAKALGQDPAGEKTALRTGMTIAELCDQYSARDNGKQPETIRSDNSRIEARHVEKMDTANPKTGSAFAESLLEKQKTNANILLARITTLAGTSTFR
jgi:hypothetical protein